MKKFTLLALVGVSYGYFYSSHSVAPELSIKEINKQPNGRFISSIPSQQPNVLAIDIKNELNVNEQKIVEALNSSSFEKVLASLFVLHSKSESIGNESYFKLTKSLSEEILKSPKQSVESLKKAFLLPELKNEYYERSTLIILGRSLPEVEKSEIARLSEDYLEKEFLSSSLNVSDLSGIESSSLSLPVAAFEETYRLKLKESKEKAKQWSKNLSEKCKNKVLKQSFLEKENSIISQSV